MRVTTPSVCDFNWHFYDFIGLLCINYLDWIAHLSFGFEAIQDGRRSQSMTYFRLQFYLGLCITIGYIQS